MTEYCQIELTQGQVARVSPKDFERLIQWKWCAAWSPIARSFYAVRTSCSGGRRTVYMHREILGIEKCDKRNIDHVSGETLDNRRSNLRFATHAQNLRNQGLSRNNTSGYKGVNWHRKTKKWIARITLNRKSIHLGYYDTPELGHAAYTLAAEKYHGEFARTA